MISPTDAEYNRGVLVVDYGAPMFQLNGVIFGGYSDHEYGHHLQQQDVGDEAYYATVVVPSLLLNGYQLLDYLITENNHVSYYHGVSWEADANTRAMEYNNGKRATRGLR